MFRRALPAIVAALLVATAGCGSGSASEDASGGASSCVLSLVSDGHVYIGWHAGRAVAEGGSLGRGSLPSCNDSGPTTGTVPVERIEVAAIEGVPPSIGVIWHGRDDEVFIRDDVDRGSLPSGLVSLIRPLRCRSADEPIRFVARMLGIAPARPGRAFDVAPFDLDVLVLQSSPKRYERGSVRVRVPAELASR
jgi:Family of unknown function (DUF6281)